MSGFYKTEINKTEWDTPERQVQMVAEKFPIQLDIYHSIVDI